MARLMLSAGMFSALAASTAVRRRGLLSTSPPPARAAMAISLIRRVKILPRLASVAAFLCLIVAHLECPDIVGELIITPGKPGPAPPPAPAPAAVGPPRRAPSTSPAARRSPPAPPQPDRSAAPGTR